MTLDDLNWNTVRDLDPRDLHVALFRLIQQASLLINKSATDDPKLLELVPRLADIIPTHDSFSDLWEPYNALARSTGLWNYINKDYADFSEDLLVESVTSEELDGITFHREQISALSQLLAGNNLILSAPTSFGKSLLIDALIASKKYRRIAIVLPTIALLDEFRRRLRKRFGEKFQIVMHHSEKIDSDCVIFLGTQERLIGRSDLGRIDLTVVDEFYKLDPNRRDERSATLNAAVYKLLQKSDQFFFLGPNIDRVQVPSDGRWNFQFLKTRFATVAVETLDLSWVGDKQERLFNEISEDKNWPALVFVSSPDRANRLAIDAAKQIATSDESDAFADWLRENVGPNWPIIEAIEFGFAVHHGRLPRAIASHMVRLFNQLILPVMFCTSTLIEGVNTAAKTVLIYDKKISRRDYDFFTFSNIRGRAGRLGHHHVGQVMLFNSPPDVQETEVAPTLFDDDHNAPDDYVVHLEDDDSSTSVDERVAFLETSLDLDREGLRLAASIGLENAIRLKQVVENRLRRTRDLAWSGRGTYDQIGSLVAVISEIKNPREFGAFSKNQLTYLITNLRSSSSVKSFLLNYDLSFQGDPNSYENVFKFLRSCEYGLPQIFSVVELFVNTRYECNYSLFLQEISRWFRPEVLKNLDEEGIPVQISERFYRSGFDRTDLDVLP